jgi:hypothetical protein
MSSRSVQTLHSRQALITSLLLLASLSPGCSPAAPTAIETSPPLQAPLTIPPTWTLPNPPTTAPQAPASEIPASPPFTVEGVDLFPGESDGLIESAIWLDNNRLAVAFAPLIPYSPEAEMTAAARPAEGYSAPPLQWLEYVVTTHVIRPIPAPFRYDPSFWDRNEITRIADYPELYGYFSPTGDKVIYNVWHGTAFDPSSSTDILVSNVASGSSARIFEFGYSNVYIYRAQWTSDEQRVYFTAAYEGPAELYVADLQSGQTTGISAVTDWEGVTEDTFRLSPDDATIAAIDWSGQLILVNLEDGSLRVADSRFSSIPIWGSDPKKLTYWWGDEWMEYTQFRSLDTATLQSTVLFDASQLASMLRDLGRNLPAEDERYLLGGIYAISPSGTRVFLWQFHGGPIMIDLDAATGA